MNPKIKKRQNTILCKIESYMLYKNFTMNKETKMNKIIK